MIENPQFEVGLYSVATDVDNLDQVVAHLQEKGCDTTGQIIPTSVARMTFVLDANGTRIC